MQYHQLVVFALLKKSWIPDIHTVHLMISRLLCWIIFRRYIKVPMKVQTLFPLKPEGSIVRLGILADKPNFDFSTQSAITVTKLIHLIQSPRCILWFSRATYQHSFLPQRIFSAKKKRKRWHQRTFGSFCTATRSLKVLLQKYICLWKASEWS